MATFGSALGRRDCLTHVAGALLGAAALATTGRSALASPTCQGTPLRVGAHGFRYLDELYYLGKPNLLELGFSPVHVAYTWQIWGERGFDGTLEHQVPYDSIATYPRRYGLDVNPPELVILDIEHWPLFRVSREEIEASIMKYRQAFVAFRQALGPKVKLAYYNIGPLPSYFYKVENGYKSSGYASWRKDNEILVPLMECFDFIVPSLYLRKTMTLPQWERRAQDFIAEARRLAGDDRMVIPFLWPQYADLDPFRPIPGDVWRKKLTLVRELADSVVLWRRAKGPNASFWKEDADWWHETQRAIERG